MKSRVCLEGLFVDVVLVDSSCETSFLLDRNDERDDSHSTLVKEVKKKISQITW